MIIWIALGSSNSTRCAAVVYKSAVATVGAPVLLLSAVNVLLSDLSDLRAVWAVCLAVHHHLVVCNCLLDGVSLHIHQEVSAAAT